MTDREILRAARAILPLLDSLLGADAAKVRARLRVLLAAATGSNRQRNADKILELLTRYPAARQWLSARSSGQPPSRKGVVAAAAPSDVPAKGYWVIPIHFATDRQVSGDLAPKLYFTGDRAPDDRMTYGTCEVSMPGQHQKGTLESPSWRRLEFRENPVRHVTLMTLTTLPEGEFFSSVDRTGTRGLIFIHGYNVTFENAVRRMAQIAWDLKFEGVPILYSWPSRGTARGYAADEATIDSTVPHLQQFILDLAQRTAITTFHVIAHSMGNRALTQALKNMALANIGPKFHQVVFTAPDVDAQVFRQLVPDMTRIAERVTLYASADDKALTASRKYHSAPRAGDAGRRLLVLKGIDSIDATGVDTSFLAHSYFGAVRTVLSDLIQLIEGVPAGKRTELKAALCAAGSYFRFVR